MAVCNGTPFTVEKISPRAILVREIDLQILEYSQLSISQSRSLSPTLDSLKLIF